MADRARRALVVRVREGRVGPWREVAIESTPHELVGRRTMHDDNGPIYADVARRDVRSP